MGSAMKSVLSIAGSDSSGGAGIQADLKTIESFHLYGQTAITSLTAQNTTGVYGVFDALPEFVSQQIDVVFDDIVPDAVKVGMVSNAGIVSAIAHSLIRNQAHNIVVDPVMVATSGASLSSDSALFRLVSELMPLADVVTPNIPEAEVLCGFPIRTEADQERAAFVLVGIRGCEPGEGAAIRFANGRFPRAVLVKGGHGKNDANDVLVDSSGCVTWFRASRVDTNNTHGTGCTLSSAIACGLASGFSLEDSIRQAKTYITGALSDGLDLGRGSGPMNHMWVNRLLI